ncbi:hypothetical protein OG455_01665 [Kitasatospora sp. NBC_01287]|uniref:hypothetical protein n=1 Tax=Kitasatospora sp. NBC_01287 TaxID=2903573 RepID=UPI002254BEE1|nr:hypothetical protein [Kitasatospora sp. NBC_01287]MCX4744232.1 hypothetical protein [Kitasatospora sp. NBC_01287]
MSTAAHLRTTLFAGLPLLLAVGLYALLAATGEAPWGAVPGMLIAIAVLGAITATGLAGAARRVRRTGR